MLVRKPNRTSRHPPSGHRTWNSTRALLAFRFPRAVAVVGDGRMIVKVGKQESLQGRIVCCSLLAESREPFWSLANIFDRRDARCRHALLRGHDKIGGQQIQNVLQSLVEFQFLSSSRMRGVHLRVRPAKEWSFAAQNA